MKLRRRATLAAVACLLLLCNACGVQEALETLNRSIVFFYKPVAYCQGLFHPAGRNEIRGMPYFGDVALIFKVTYVRNGHAGAESIAPSSFYVRRGYPWGGQTGPRLTELEAVMLSSGEETTKVGVVGLPIGEDTTRDEGIFEPHRDAQGEPDGDLVVHFGYLPLIYDPDRDGDTAGSATFNVGRSSVRAKQWPCDAEEIRARAASL